MAELELDTHLHHPKDDFHRLYRNTHPGQAHLAGSGPKGRTCRECVHWSNRGDWYASGGSHKGKLKPARCNKYTRLMQGQEGGRVPHSASACRHFELNHSPLTITEGQA